ncbi:hypothetical protein BDV37DRAFT_26153 [Aspergillus pseudonomiae]|uniref:Uncharacterized protein n=1 Tax=Aspergillus pseudonomiae TaxID=1506151 RepID=A0A5N7CY81_9EURO|nr:uncharacterized protein BDV37DRAFT_26153 [Aspergillus pseudonomiae]KAE8398543.1 hypothetical protein BDV37DRAFT_26153 [Aspergillus pseudonomiae]
MTKSVVDIPNQLPALRVGTAGTWSSDLKSTICKITRSNHARTERSLALYLDHLISYNLINSLYLAISVGLHLTANRLWYAPRSSARGGPAQKSYRVPSSINQGRYVTKQTPEVADWRVFLHGRCLPQFSLPTNPLYPCPATHIPLISLLKKRNLDQ